MLCIIILSLGFDSFFDLSLKFFLHDYKVQGMISYRWNFIFVLILDVFIPLQNFSIQTLKQTYVSCFVDTVIVHILDHS